ncbi:hypothetical protein MHYP_G00204530 [Metynnis hypsauchen]
MIKNPPKKETEELFKAYGRRVPPEQAVCIVPVYGSNSIIKFTDDTTVMNMVRGSIDFNSEKKGSNRIMFVQRLQEEKKILVREIKQHWDSLKACDCVLSK